MASHLVNDNPDPHDERKVVDPMLARAAGKIKICTLVLRARTCNNVRAHRVESSSLIRTQPMHRIRRSLSHNIT